MSSYIPAFLPVIAITRSVPTLSPTITPLAAPRAPPFRFPRRSIRATADDPSVAAPDTTRSTGHDCRIELDGKKIAYDYFPGIGPTIVFLPAFFDLRWRQSKASALEIFAKRAGRAILVKEYLGIGRSEGDFLTEGTISRWVRDTVGLLDRVLGDEKVILVGAGIGGWIMLHVAARLPHRVVGLVGVNPSVDFTEDLLVPNLTEEQKEQLEKSGSVDMEWGYRTYPISKVLIEDAKRWLVLREELGELRVECPVRLLQGLNDEEIPPERVLKLVQRIPIDDVVLQFIKYGDHMMEGEQDLERMWDAVEELAGKYFEYDLTSPGSG